VSERVLSLAAAALALAGLAVSGYLTYIHYAGIAPVCAGGGGACERVQSSHYAELAGVPVALLGLVGYALILAALRVVCGQRGADDGAGGGLGRQAPARPGVAQTAPAASATRR
jgi:uncharacterized membrane protein